MFLNGDDINIRQELENAGLEKLKQIIGVHSLIANFNSLDIRNDKRALWENFLIAERMKYNEYNNNWVNKYFWRTKQQQEIDYIEEKDGILYAYEFKWQKTKKAKLPAKFAAAYPEHNYEIITRENFTEFIGKTL